MSQMAARESILLSVALLFFLGTAALVTASFHQQQHQHRRSSTSSSNNTKRRIMGSHVDDDDDDHKKDLSSFSNVVLQVTGLQRFAVKGLSPDTLETVDLTSSTFPDDRRYALWKTAKKEEPEETWKEDTWMHKENFVCAFTHPKVLAQFETSYNRQDDNLTLRDRATGRLRLGPIALATEMGRTQLAEFVTQETGVLVQCVTSANGDFHFGNTSSATQHKTMQQPNGDDKARCMHLVLQSTVDALADKIGIPLNAARFRPNIILQPTAAGSTTTMQTLAPFQELSWVGKTLQSTTSTLELEIIRKTVRCAGVSVDPLLDLDQEVLDIPALLMKHFPEHGPYLGVYCVLKQPGTLTRGDTLRLVE